MLSGVENILERSVVARWLLALPFGIIGLLLVGLAPASGLLSLPFGVLLTTMAVWAILGATDPPPRGIKWTLAISAGVSALMILTGIVLAIKNNF